ncbi:hypothetical protein EOM82_07630, partial [bacterium]|nr:hypothetical protein [bacterium]
MKTPFITKEKALEIINKYPTPFHIYDKAGIVNNAKRLNSVFSFNKGFKEYFAVKATPNPTILKILKAQGCGVDCSSLTELLMAKALGFSGDEIMFSSNETAAEEFVLARELNAIINLDDITHINFLKKAAGLPKKICLRYNPGGDFTINNQIMGNPADAPTLSLSMNISPYYDPSAGNGLWGSFDELFTTGEPVFSVSVAFQSNDLARNTGRTTRSLADEKLVQAS